MKTKDTRKKSLGGILLVGIFLLAGCLLLGTARSGAARIELNGLPHDITGPYSHQNLWVYLIHSDQQDEREFITLSEGLRDQLVKVTEKEQEQVSELQIENLSDRYLFLQEGDRVKGGKQDRTIFSSFVVPPKSGKIPLPAFCIEQSRWTEGSTGKVFTDTKNFALAPKEVRQAAKVSANQGEVWQAVQVQKDVANLILNAPNTNSSLNETLDAPNIKRLSDECASALRGVLEQHPKAVGVAIAVNGRIEEANIYPNHALLTKQYTRLLESYAVQAAIKKREMVVAQPIGAADIARFLNTGGEKSQHAKQINAANGLEVRHMEAAVECRTKFDGQLVHWQRLSAQERRLVRPANGDLGQSGGIDNSNGQISQNDLNALANYNNDSPTQVISPPSGFGNGQGGGVQVIQWQGGRIQPARVVPNRRPQPQNAPNLPPNPVGQQQQREQQ